MNYGHQVSLVVDTTYINYFNNWYIQMNLMCTASAVVGLIYTMERITEGIWGFTTAGVTDLYGRRKSTLVLLGLNLIAQTIIIFCPSYSMRMLGFIIYGIGNTKNSVCYIWLCELMETRHKSSACSVLNTFNSATIAIFGLYVLFISRDWFYIIFFMYLLGVISWFIILLMIPEAPRWLLINGRTKDALTSFEHISSLNAVEFTISPDAVFIE